MTVLSTGRLRQLHRFAGTVWRLAAIMRARRPALILNWSAKTQLYGSCAALLAGMPSRVLWWQQSIPDGSAIDRLATALPARAILCYSEAAARAQRRLWRAPETFPIAAGTAVPAATGEPAQIALPPGVPVVGIVGRLQEWKGQDRLLRAQALLHARGTCFHCLIVGGDAYELSPDYAASLPRLVSELGLDGQVTMTGQVPDAGPYIERMDVLVNASDPEPFGIVLLEGMARGVAVLAVDSGGPSEFIADMRTGVLAASGAPEALADGLGRLVEEPELRARLAVAGRESFLRDYTDAAMRAAYVRVPRIPAPLAVRGAAGLIAPPRSAPAAGPAGASEAARADAVAVTIVAHDVGAVGGMERQLAELAVGLSERGHPVTVIARKCVLPAGSGVEFHRVRGPSRPFLLAYPWFALAGSLAVRRRRRGLVQSTGAIVVNRVDSVAIHCCHQAYTAKPGRPGRAYALYGQAVGAVKRVSERLSVRRNRDAWFVCVSDGVAEEVRNSFPAVAAHVSTIHNGVDTAEFAPGAAAEEGRALRERARIWRRGRSSPLSSAATGSTRGCAT